MDPGGTAAAHKRLVMCDVAATGEIEGLGRGADHADVPD